MKFNEFKVGMAVKCPFPGHGTHIVQSIKDDAIIFDDLSIVSLGALDYLNGPYGKPFKRYFSPEKRVHKAVAPIMTNAMNYPVGVDVQVLGRDMSGVIDKVVAAVMALGWKLDEEDEEH